MEAIKKEQHAVHNSENSNPPPLRKSLEDQDLNENDQKIITNATAEDRVKRDDEDRERKRLREEEVQRSKPENTDSKKRKK